MLSTIQSQINALRNKSVSWDKEIAEFFNNPQGKDGEVNHDLLDTFTEILVDLLKLIKTEPVHENDAVALFDGYECKEYVSKYINIKMRTYNGFKPLLDLALSDIFKAKYCVDLIWSSYILRFNPHLVFDEQIPLNEADFKMVAAQLDDYTNFCIDRGYHICAVEKELKNSSDFPDALCEYIAEKIDKNFEKLKLNFIIQRLYACEQAIDKLSEK